ncbi:MAG: glycosyltransferase family 4 protein [Ignavibacteria bacterium]
MEMFTVQSAEQLLRHDLDVYLFCLKDSKIDLNSNFIPEHKKLKVKSNSYLNIKNILLLRKFILQNEINLIHTQFSKDLWTISPALMLIDKKIHLVLTKQLGSFIKKKDFLHKMIYKKVDKAIAISSVIKQNLIETTPLKEEKVVIIPNVVDLTKFNPSKYNREKIRTELEIENDVFVFTNIARLSPGKGQDAIINAIISIKDKLHGTLFFFVGEAETSEKFYEESLKNLVKKNSLERLIKFLGFRNDIPEILASSDAFIFPSYAEAFGISLVEALAMGLPNIVCKADGVLDIIIEEETSLVFDRDDIQKLSENILRIRFDEELRKKLSQKSLDRAKDFSFEKYNERILNLYEGLLKKK